MIRSNVRLSECCEIVSGATPRRNVPEYWNGDIAWVTPKDLSKIGNKVIAGTPEGITREGLNSCSAKILPKGALLFSSRAPIGHIAITGRPMATNQGFKSLIPFDDVDVNYLYWCLKHITPSIVAKGRGATFKEISKEIMENIEISLPPLEEQKRIAAILDKADAIRKKRKQAIELTEQFLRSAFLGMFGDPITNPKDWPTAIMKDCIADISSGWSAKGENKIKESNDWGVLKISAVTSGRFLASEHKVVSSIESGRKLIVPKRGDLLFSRANTRELVAATCLVEENSERLFLPDKLWRLTVSNDMKPEYLRYLLAHPRYRSYLTRQATGTSGSMLNVSQQKLMGMKLPKPPIEVQQAFSDIVWKTYQLQATSNVSAENMTAQFNGLTQRAFRGEL